MKNWLKGGFLVAIIYVLVQFIDDFFYVFFNITPLEKVRQILYLDFFSFQDIILKCSNFFDFCGIIYIIILGFIIGCIIGAIAGILNRKEGAKEIKSEVEDTMKEFKWEDEEKIKKEGNIKNELKRGDQKSKLIIKGKKEGKSRKQIRKKQKKNVRKGKKVR